MPAGPLQPTTHAKAPEFQKLSENVTERRFGETNVKGAVVVSAYL